VVSLGELRRRRRENAAGGRRVIAHQVKVSVEEEAVLVRLAEAARVSVPRLLVESATSLPGGRTPTERRDAIVELLGLSRTLSGIAGNLNQLARSVNAGAEFPRRAVEVREEIRLLIPQISQACDDLRNPGNPAPRGPVPGRPGGGGMGEFRGPSAAEVGLVVGEAGLGGAAAGGMVVDGVRIDAEGRVVGQPDGRVLTDPADADGSRGFRGAGSGGSGGRGGGGR